MTYNMCNDSWFESSNVVVYIGKYGWQFEVQEV